MAENEGVQDDPERKRRHVLKWAVLIVGIAALLQEIYLFQYRSGGFYDLNLHYFGAIAEREGSYTDLAKIQLLAREHHVTVPAEGVYGTPALVAWLYMPLTYLSLEAAHTVWMAITCLALVTGFSFLSRSRIAWPMWMLATTFGTALLLSMSLGNVSTLTFALLLITYGALRDNRSQLAGIALGVAIALKGYPAFLLLVLLYQRRWKEIAYTLATVAGMFAFTFFVLGPQDFITATKATLDVAGYVHPYHDNISISAVLLGTLTDSANVAKLVTYGLTATAAALLFLLRRASLPLLFGLAASLMLVAQSISWVHYFPLTVVTAVVVWEATSSRFVRIATVTALFASNGTWVYILLTTSTPNSRIFQCVGTVALIVLATREALSDARQQPMSRELAPLPALQPTQVEKIRA